MAEEAVRLVGGCGRLRRGEALANLEQPGRQGCVGRDVELLERTTSAERRAAGLPEGTGSLRTHLEPADRPFECAEPRRVLDLHASILAARPLVSVVPGADPRCGFSEMREGRLAAALTVL